MSAGGVGAQLVRAGADKRACSARGVGGAPRRWPRAEPGLRPRESSSWSVRSVQPLLERTARSHWPPAMRAAVYAFEGPTADGIRRVKYEGRCDLAPQLGELLADSAVAYSGRVDAVVPVPLSPSSPGDAWVQPGAARRSRGAPSRVPLRPSWLRRVRLDHPAGRAQQDPSRHQRCWSVRGGGARLCTARAGDRRRLHDGATLEAARVALSAPQRGGLPARAGALRYEKRTVADTSAGRHLRYPDVPG